MSEGWEIKKLGDVCEVIAGQSPKSQFYNEDKVGLPFYQGKKEFQKKYIGEPTKWTSKITKEALEDDILMSVRAPVGPVNFSTQKCCIGRGLAAIRSSELIDKDYCFYYLQSKEDELIGNSGAVFNSINKTQIGNIPIPIPPLQEQKQIVAILDKAFAAIDQAQVNIERNIENAIELFQSKLNAIFNPPKPEALEGWEKKTLGEICEKTKNIKWQEFTTEEFEYIDLSSVSRETLSVTETATVNKKNAPSRAKKIIQNGDVIFATTRPTLRRATIIDEELSGNICSTGFVVLRPKQYLSSEWIFFFLLTSSFMSRMESLQRGASYPAVTDSDVKGSTLSVPISKEIEKRNIQVMNDIQEYSNNLISHYKQKLINLEDLKKSILQKAFSGELSRKEMMANEL